MLKQIKTFFGRRESDFRIFGSKRWINPPYILRLQKIWNLSTMLKTRIEWHVSVKFVQVNAAVPANICFGCWLNMVCWELAVNWNKCVVLPFGFLLPAYSIFFQCFYWWLRTTDCRPDINLNDAHNLINFPYNLMWQNFVRRFWLLNYALHQKTYFELTNFT